MGGPLSASSWTGSGNACRTSRTPSQTSWAWPSSMCWRFPASCWRSRRRVWRGTGGEGMWLPPSIPCPVRGGTQAPSCGREACLYVHPLANDSSSSLSSPQGRAQDADLPWRLHTAQWDKGWDCQSLGLHGDEPEASGERELGVTNCHQLSPCRCRTYGSIPLARLQPRTFYNASWSSPATPPSPSLQSPAPSKPRQKQRPLKRPPQRKGSKRPNKTNTTALQVPVASIKPDISPTAWLEVTHPGLQGSQNGLKPQGELRT